VTVKSEPAFDDRRMASHGRGHRAALAERGQNIVEFAIAAPLLFLVVCAIFEFGNLLLTQVQLQNAVRQGARYAALSGCPTNSAIQSVVQSAAASLPITVSSSFSPSPCASCLGVQIPTLTVTGTYTYQALTPVGAFFKFFGSTFSNSLSLSSTSTMNNEC
jgi:Flp pilus assembly protein TadG